MNRCRDVTNGEECSGAHIAQDATEGGPADRQLNGKGQWPPFGSAPLSPGRDDCCIRCCSLVPAWDRLRQMPGVRSLETTGDVPPRQEYGPEMVSLCLGRARCECCPVGLNNSVGMEGCSADTWGCGASFDGGSLSVTAPRIVKLTNAGVVSPCVALLPWAVDRLLRSMVPCLSG